MTTVPESKDATFGEFFDRNVASLRRVLRRQFSADGYFWWLADADVDDIVSATMEEMLGRWDTITSPSSYMFTVGLRLAKQYVANRYSQPVDFSAVPDSVVDMLGTAAADPSDAATATDYLSVAVTTMSFAEKQVFLRRIAGYSNQEVAQQLGSTVASVKGRYLRALDKARDNLAATDLRNHR
ncbi:RNA polymerase sigma factor [Nocardia sp. NPDC004722]